MLIVRAYAKKIGLVGVINRSVAGERDVEPGHMDPAIIPDTLTGRSPLCHLEPFIESRDIALLPGIPYRCVHRTSGDEEALEQGRFMNTVFPVLMASCSRATADYGLPTSMGLPEGVWHQPGVMPVHEGSSV